MAGSHVVEAWGKAVEACLVEEGSSLAVEGALEVDILLAEGHSQGLAVQGVLEVDIQEEDHNLAVVGVQEVDILEADHNQAVEDALAEDIQEEGHNLVEVGALEVGILAGVHTQLAVAGVRVEDILEACHSQLVAAGVREEDSLLEEAHNQEPHVEAAHPGAAAAHVVAAALLVAAPAVVAVQVAAVVVYPGLTEAMPALLLHPLEGGSNQPLAVEVRLPELGMLEEAHTLWIYRGFCSCCGSTLALVLLALVAHGPADTYQNHTVPVVGAPEEEDPLLLPEGVLYAPQEDPPLDCVA